MIIKILKDITNTVELAVEVGKRNCKRLHSIIINGKMDYIGDIDFKDICSIEMEGIQCH